MSDEPPNPAGEIADALNRLRGGGWIAEGARVRGPGTMAVDVDYRIDHRVQAGMAHLDLTLLLNVDRPDSSIIDCIAGIGVDEREAVRQAVSSWVTTTASAIFEVVDHQGALATHFPPGSEYGFKDWHTVGGYSRSTDMRARSST